MDPVELMLLAGTGAILTLRSPRARTIVGRGVARTWQYAAPAVRSASHAARDRVADRVADLRGRWAPQIGQAPCIHPGCTWTGPASSAVLLDHLRTAHASTKPEPTTARRKPSPYPRQGTAGRPAEQVTQVAPGVYIARQIDQTIERIGLHMDEFRAVTRALNAASEIRPTSLLELLESLTGIQAALAGLANTITDIAEYADLEMNVDLRGIAPLYEAAGAVMAEATTVRTAMARIRSLYEEEIAVEEKAQEQRVRPLNPKVVKSAA